MKEEKEKTLEYFEKQLRKEDFETLVNRGLRLRKLDSFKIAVLPTMRIYDYIEEAKTSYINRCFRSCIICSSIAVEQIFRHILTIASEDWEETYWRVEIGKMTFGDILREVKTRKIKALTKCIKDADWLRMVRNRIGAHPPYISDYFRLKKLDQLIWANKLMFRDIRKLLQSLEPQKRKEVEMEKITVKDSWGKEIESTPFKDFLKDPTKIKIANYFDWFLIQNMLLEELAFEAYKKMVKIVNGLNSYIESGLAQIVRSQTKRSNA